MSLLVSAIVTLAFALPFGNRFASIFEGQTAQATDRFRFQDLTESTRAMLAIALNTQLELAPLVFVEDHGRYDEFNRDCEWRRECWAALDRALNPEVSGMKYLMGGLCGRDYLPILSETEKDIIRKMFLEDLRILLGDADYYAGRMPMPSPPCKIRGR